MPTKPQKKTAKKTERIKLTDELRRTFVSMCEVYDIQMVRESLGIRKGVYDGWITQGKKGKEKYRQFYYDMKAAKAKRRMRNVQTIQKAADAGDWKAAGWLLSRLERERYGDHVSTENTHDVKNISFVDLWEMAKKGQ